MSNKKKTAKKTAPKRRKMLTQKELEECCIHEDVMKQIHDEHLTMKPKVYYFAGSALVGAGMAGAVLTSIFFTNLTLYKLRYDAAFEYLGFGAPGFNPFVKVFPWVPFIIAVGGLVGGSHLLKKYDISYKHRYTRILIAFIALILTLGFLLDRLGTNTQMQKMKPLKLFYEHQEAQPFIHGKVVQVYGTRAVIITPYDEKISVDLRYVPSKIVIKPGAAVRAIGTWKDRVFVIERILVR